jgi:hypothetical protein
MTQSFLDRTRYLLGKTRLLGRVEEGTPNVQSSKIQRYEITACPKFKNGILGGQLLSSR